MGSSLLKKLSWLTMVLLVVLTVVRVTRQASPFDSVNVDVVLKNEALVRRHINCLKCKGPCDRIGSELKRVLPIVARNNCANCTPQEKAKLGKIISHAQSRYPQDWQDIAATMRSGRAC